jgi:hypothetical protein
MKIFYAVAMRVWGVLIGALVLVLLLFLTATRPSGRDFQIQILDPVVESWTARLAKDPTRRLGLTLMPWMKSFAELADDIDQDRFREYLYAHAQHSDYVLFSLDTICVREGGGVYLGVFGRFTEVKDLRGQC